MMKCARTFVGKIGAIACATALAMALAVSPAFADTAETDSSQYQGTTYRVVVYGGNQGTVNGSDKVVFEGEQAARPGEAFDFGNITVSVPEDSKYYAKGIRLAALDNVQSDNIRGEEVAETIYYMTVNSQGDLVATNSAVITEDTDFVVAYGVKANRVAYTVTYVDTDGNILAEPQQFFGDIGDRPAVAAAYIEGYVPRVDVQLQTLTANEEENVFPFVYTRLADDVVTTPNDNGGVDIELPSGATVPDAYTTTPTPEAVASAEQNPVPRGSLGGFSTEVGTTEDDADAAANDTAEPLVADDGSEVLGADGTPLTAPVQESIEDDGTALTAGDSSAALGSEQVEPDRSWMPWAAAAIILAAAIAFILVRGRGDKEEEQESAA